MRYIRGHRFLTEDVLPRSECRFRLRGMFTIPGDDRDRIKIRSGTELAIIGVQRGNIESGCEKSQPFRPTTTYCHNPRVRMGLQPRQMTLLCKGSGSDHADAERSFSFCHW